MKKICKYEEENSLEKTPIVSFTINALNDDKNKYIAAGMDGYISKAINASLLDEYLTKYLQVR